MHKAHILHSRYRKAELHYHEGYQSGSLPGGERVSPLCRCDAVMTRLLGDKRRDMDSRWGQVPRKREELFNSIGSKTLILKCRRDTKYRTLLLHDNDNNATWAAWRTIGNLHCHAHPRSTIASTSRVDLSYAHLGKSQARSNPIYGE